ncbi:MAG TPA: hypothetical protein VMT75_01805 [Candidatus Saccharimonadales bacterium]|nr:hypothetical protein [Candidatus Saccharimonadales bacterium]
MMAALIFSVSVVTLLMFFVSYCRSLMAASSRHVLSREVRDVTGIRDLATARDYPKLMQLLELCPERPEDRVGLRAVSVYYDILDVTQKSIARLIPRLQAWMEHERAGCANFAAVALDRRIAFNRESLLREAEF